ncbi:MAG: ABC transporter permease [Chloroflexota bacterium]
MDPGAGGLTAMEILGNGVAWLLDPAHWSGSNGIPVRLLEHVALSGASFLVAALVAVPVGLYTGHTGRWGTTVLNVASIGRAIPSYALLLVFFTLTGVLGAPTTLPTLVLLAIPPLLAGVHVAIREVDRDTIEAGRGMGMRELQVLRRVELPAGMPLIFVGARTAAVQVVATATLGALVAGGGLGRYIVDGFALRGAEGTARLVAGAILVALLAIATERLFTLVERRVAIPRGIRAATPVGLRPRPGGI